MVPSYISILNTTQHAASFRTQENRTQNTFLHSPLCTVVVRWVNIIHITNDAAQCSEASTLLHPSLLLLDVGYVNGNTETNWHNFCDTHNVWTGGPEQEDSLSTHFVPMSPVSWCGCVCPAAVLITPDIVQCCDQMLRVRGCWANSVTCAATTSCVNNNIKCKHCIGYPFDNRISTIHI